DVALQRVSVTLGAAWAPRVARSSQPPRDAWFAWMNRRAPRLADAASLPADPPSCRARQAAAGNWKRSTKVRVSDQDQRETAPGREHQAPTSARSSCTAGASNRMQAS